MTLHYLAVRPYGDTVISLALLQRLPQTVSDVRILGSNIVDEVARATGLGRFPSQCILQDVAAFFDVHVKGPVAALGDLITVRRELAATFRAGDRLLVEQRDWRNHLLLRPGSQALCEPPRTHSVYRDRCALLEQQFGCALTLPLSRLPSARAASMALNPDARQPTRTFPKVLVDWLLDFAARRGLAVHFIDPRGEYAHLAGRVQQYLPRPSLGAAVECLRRCDFFVGPDSFFLHLAYLYEIPLFGIGATRNPYFAPPGMVEQGASLSLDLAASRGRLFASIGAIFQ